MSLNKEENMFCRRAVCGFLEVDPGETEEVALKRENFEFLTA
jgi:NADH pyrophosphatase NudC (nudix superfamily)